MSAPGIAEELDIPLTTAKQGIPVPVPMSVTKGMGIPSIDLPQMPVSHPGVWFLFGCIFKVVLLMLMKYRRKDV